jgi:hypothetical protein
MKTILANILPGSDLFDGDKIIPLASTAFRKVCCLFIEELG